MTDEKIKKYPKSKKGNFYIKDTIGIPHPYCITPKHLQYNDSMYLGTNEIREAEKKGAVCDICRKLQKEGKQQGILTIDEHKQALLVACKVEAKDNKELHKYLLDIKEQAEKDNFEGFAFLQEFKK